MLCAAASPVGGRPPPACCRRPPLCLQASLATGHISPPWFVRRLRATGWLPRRVALLGSLQPLPAAEVRGPVRRGAGGVLRGAVRQTITWVGRGSGC